MFKELKVMKTNILNTMKQFAKYFCTVVVILGMSVSAWGAIYIEYDGNKYYNGNTITINVEIDGELASSVDAMTIKNDGDGWSSSTYYRGYIHATISGSYVYSNIAFGMAGVEGNNGTPYWEDDEHYTSFYEWNNWQYETLSFYTSYAFDAIGTYNSTITITQKGDDNESTLQSATITISYVVTCIKLGTASGLSVNTHYEYNDQTYVRFEWTRGTDVASHATNQKFCLWPEGEEATCNASLSASSTSTRDLRSKLSNGKYGWSIQALGNNAGYCDSEVAEGVFCIDDVATSTPSGIDANPITLNSATISWSAMSNAVGYALTIKKKSDGSVVPGFNEKDVVGTSANVTGLSAGTTYKVELQAYNDCADLSLINTSYEFTTQTEYAITLDGNDGEDGIAGVYANATALHEITAPSRSNYTLEGYYTDAACTQQIATSAGALIANVTVSAVQWTDGDGKWIKGGDATFYANWTPVNYTISFNANGGLSTMESVERAYNTTYALPACGFTAPDGKAFECWAEGSAGGTERAVGYSHTVTGDITFYAKWREIAYTDAKFSCADWTLTGPEGNIVFITSAANKTVRSQEAFHVSGNGLPHSTALTFSIFPASSKFVIKKADGTIPQTDEYGVVDADVYVFYTPGEGDTSDGLDEFTSLTVSVTGEPRTATIDTKRVIGRHIATDFVIAVKRNNKWLALPATMNDLTNPSPVEIAVDNIDNPSAAYTAASNIYNLYGQNSGSGGKLYTNGETVKLGMKNNSNKPLFGSATGTSTVKGDGTATVTNNIGSQYWWTLSQTATSITNPQDAQYSITCSNNTAPFVLKENAGNPQWGFFTTGSVGAIRLIPATDIPFTEAEVVEWGRNGAILEVNAQGIDATSVVAHLGEATSAAITLNQTGTSVKGTGTKYNYTVNFGEGIDFAATASNGAMLTLEWKNGETVKAMSNIIVPKIVATSTTMSSLMATDDPWNKADVHVLPGVTLTANAGDFSSKDVVVDRLEIYPGATVKVTKGAQDAGTLKVRTLVLRNGWTRVGTKNYDVARLYVSTDASLAKNAVDNVWYSDWYIDYDQYYPIAVPFWVATSSITYKNTKSTATAGVKIRYYDGARRAEHGQQEQAANWVEYTWGSTMPENLEPSKGYAMTAKRPTGKAFSIVRMPMSIPSNSWTASGEHGYIGETHKDQVSVTAWGKGSAEWYAMGWNFIGNPYMCTFNGNDDGISGKITTQEGGSIKYATIPDLEFKNYDQVPIAEANLKPASAFFIQADNASAQTITFSDGKIVPPSAPIRYMANDETVPEQEAYIRLSHEGGKDQMGLIIGEDYTEAYEPNADLAKMLGEANAVKTYMRYGEMDMAYVAINQTLAKQWIPITVKIPADGEYTYSLTRSSTVDALEGIYLIDYGNGDKITNLLEETYQFEADAGTISGRFAINAIFGERPVPTDIDIVGSDINGSEPIKFLYHDKVFILHNGVIYDATGKKVREIK